MSADHRKLPTLVTLQENQEVTATEEHVSDPGTESIPESINDANVQSTAATGGSEEGNIQVDTEPADSADGDLIVETINSAANASEGDFTRSPTLEGHSRNASRQSLFEVAYEASKHAPVEASPLLRGSQQNSSESTIWEKTAKATRKAWSDTDFQLGDFLKWVLVKFCAVCQFFVSFLCTTFPAIGKWFEYVPCRNVPCTNSITLNNSSLLTKHFPSTCWKCDTPSVLCCFRYG